MKKRHDITAQTKQNLIDAFWQMYCQRPIAQITVKDVVQRAGYNRSTFYEYFTDVYAVLEEIEQQIIPTVDTLPPFAGPHGTMGMPLAQFWQWYHQNAKYYAVLLGERGDPAFAGKLKRQIKPAIMGLYATGTPAEMQRREVVVEYVLSAMIGVMVHWHQQANPMPVDELMALMQQVMEHGVVGELV
jgi:AcrR family transcriptional regulator